VRVTGSVAIPISGADAMSAHDFEVDVARVLEEYLVTDALEPTANGSVEYAGWTFEVSMT
jgi:hypothetical protein